jgi:hypothetical protein
LQEFFEQIPPFFEHFPKKGKNFTTFRPQKPTDPAKETAQSVNQKKRETDNPSGQRKPKEQKADQKAEKNIPSDLSGGKHKKKRKGSESANHPIKNIQQKIDRRPGTNAPAHNPDQIVQKAERRAGRDRI